LSLPFPPVIAQAGMPAVLPTEWTKDGSYQPHFTARTADSSGRAALVEGISFFVVVLLACAWAVRGLWQILRKDFTALPRLTYGRSLSLILLWGFLFVVVLTMISGARELMTPGAWRKQGWTYKLADAAPSQADSRAERRAALEKLRLALWQYAATHQGQFPADDDPAFDASLWEIPGWPGLRFMKANGRTADDTGHLFVFEPELEGDERQVLLTNGLLGTMRTSEIRQALARDNNDDR
jgi:hypothetical protein